MSHLVAAMVRRCANDSDDKVPTDDVVPTAASSVATRRIAWAK